MKKLFTLAAAALMSIGMWAEYPTATTTYALEALTVTEATLTYEKTGLSGDAQKLNKVLYIDVEVPCATAHGNLFMRSSASNTGRFATIWGNNGTERDESRKVAMKNGNSDPIPFTADDILEANDKYYIRFSSADNNGSYYDYKITGFSYVLAEECVNKEIVSTEESLTAVTINDVAISATALASLVSNKYLFLEDAYVTAPVVKFTKHTVITYDDQSTKEKDEVIEVTSQPATTTWGASATINGDAYYVYTSKAASRTVTYMYGEQVLGTEIVAANGNPAEYAQYETMPLATFGGWYKDADLTQAVANIAAEVISVDATYYAKFTKAFLSESVNIEQLVLDYGTSYDIRSALTAAGWAYKDLNDLDTLNDIENKTNRNEAFLGLKIKTKDAYVQGWLPSDGLLIVKFGNVGCDIKVTVKGANTDLEATYTKDQLAEQNYEFPVYGFTEEVLVTFTTTGSSTVVLKQLMMDEIAEVTLPAPGAYLVSCEEAEHGEIKASWPNKKYRTPIGETVTLTVTPNSGYKVVDVQVDGVSLNAVEGVYSFVMPAKDVTVTASFEQDEASAINNTNAAVKAVKVVRNGQLFIEKNGVVYNAQGAIVK